MQLAGLRIRTKVLVAYLRLEVTGALVLSEPARLALLINPAMTGQLTQLRPQMHQLVPAGKPVLAAQYFSPACEKVSHTLL